MKTLFSSCDCSSSCALFRDTAEGRIAWQLRNMQKHDDVGLTIRRLRGHKKEVLCLGSGDICDGQSFNSVGGVYLLSGSEDATVRVWDMRQSKAVRCIKSFDGMAVTSVSFGRNKTVFAAAGGKISQFDLRTDSVLLTTSAETISICESGEGDEFANGIDQENVDEINQIAIDAKGKVMLCADDTGSITVVQLPNDSSTAQRGDSSCNSFRAHSSICMAVAFRESPPSHVLTGGLDSIINLWNYKQPKGPLFTFDMNKLRNTSSNAAQLVNPPFVNSLATQPRSVLAAAALGNGSVPILDLRSRSLVATLDGQSSG